MFLLFKCLGFFVTLLQSISCFLDLLHVNLLTLIAHLLARVVFVSSVSSASSSYAAAVVADGAVVGLEVHLVVAGHFYII